MRLFSFLVAGSLAAASGCSRPVLYYPTPEPAPAAPAAVPVVTATTASASPAATPRELATAAEGAEYLRERQIVMPVAGVDPSKLEDTFLAGRDGDRTHRAIDILAPRGTPILAADDGKILRMSNNTLGGITIYAVDTENRLVYYYAHLDHYNDAMSPGRAISKGDTLGYVGTTGNAPKDIPHLHFQVMRWPADGKYWNGDPIDPFQALGGGQRSQQGRHASGQPIDF